MKSVVVTEARGKNILEGISFQDGTPTPDVPKPIINGFKVNGVQYIDNIPNNMVIGMFKEEYCEYLQLKEKNNQLIKEKEQFKKTIYKAIEYIKHSWWLRTDQVYDTSKDLKGWEVEELLSILERGKE